MIGIIVGYIIMYEQWFVRGSLQRAERKKW